MAFSSISFLFAFLPVALLLYWVFPAKARTVILILLSLVFYAWGDIRHLPVLLFSTLFTYVAGMEIGLHKVRKEDREAKISLIISAAVLTSFSGIGGMGR